MIQLREYQRNGANQLWTEIKEHQSVIFQLATGGGKTYIFCAFIKKYIEVHNVKVLILVHREELLQQTIKSLKNVGVECFGIEAKTKKVMESNVYVAMAQTILSRLKKDKNYIQNIGLIVTDEAHRQDFKKVFNFFEGVKRIGFSATPISASKKDHLKNYYKSIVCCADIPDLIKQGSLTVNKTFTVKGIKSSNFSKEKGEYSNSSMMSEYSKSKHIYNVVKAYEEKAKGKKTLIFNVGVEHSLLVQNAFLEKGYECKHLDGTSTDRKEVIKWFNETKNAILCNIDILTTGFDEPSVECIIVNRSTTSLPLWLQMTGRGGRLFPNKEFFTILDLGDNVSRLGDWSEKRNWSHVFYNPHEPSKNGTAPIKDCPECGYLNHAAAPTCKECGYEFKKAKKVDTENIVLELVKNPFLQVFEEDLQKYLIKTRKRIQNIDVLRFYKKTIENGYKKGYIFHSIIDMTLKCLKDVTVQEWQHAREYLCKFIIFEVEQLCKKIQIYDKSFDFNQLKSKFWIEAINEKINKTIYESI